MLQDVAVQDKTSAVPTHATVCLTQLTGVVKGDIAWLNLLIAAARRLP